jgi:branched-subunit amino acid ABC-type transport system permease component
VLGATTKRVTVLTPLLVVVLVIALTQLINHTKIGMAMRAVSRILRPAQLMGIKIDSVISFTFVIGSLLAAVGSVLYFSNYTTVIPTSGAMPGLKAFVAAVFGGIGSDSRRGDRRLYHRHLRDHHQGHARRHVLRRVYVRPAHRDSGGQAHRPVR